MASPPLSSHLREAGGRGRGVALRHQSRPQVVANSEHRRLRLWGLLPSGP